MELLPPQFANESLARPVESADDLATASWRDVVSAARKPFEPADFVEARDCTGSPTFPIETFLS